MNIVFVCHGDLTSQSTYHVLSIAEQLTLAGHHCVACIPGFAENHPGIRVTSIPLFDFAGSIKNGFAFPDGEGPSLIHCWTPREQVRRITEQLSQNFGCPYFVHLEDNERELLSRELVGINYEELSALSAEEQDRHIRQPEIRINPARHWEFLKNSAGCTVLIERLKDHVPGGTPVQVFWPGYDDGFFSAVVTPKDDLKEKYGIHPEQFVVLYSGAFHRINHDDACRMVTALKILVNRGMPLSFVKTGHNAYPELLENGVKKGWVKDLGFLPRERLPELYAMADVLIQPGGADPFNEYRFPSKLPEALASGVPVILPYCNLGLVLKEGVEAIINREDSMERLINDMVYLYENPEKRVHLGESGRAFCQAHLNWKKASGLVESFYLACLSKSREELASLGLMQTEATDYSTTTSKSCVNRKTSWYGPISPQDLYLLFQEERSLQSTGSVLADTATLQNDEISRIIYRADRNKKKAKKYKVYSAVELLIIVLLVLVLLYG